MQKWEYCEVTANSIVVTVSYYKSTGSITKSHSLGNAIVNALSLATGPAFEKARQIVAQLGLEGWEIVSFEGENARLYVLKRPLDN